MTRPREAIILMMTIAFTTLVRPEVQVSQNQQLNLNHPLKLQRTSDALRLSHSNIDIHFDKRRYLKPSHVILMSSNVQQSVIDAISTSKHIDPVVGNQIEIKPGNYDRNIVPTRSRKFLEEGEVAPQEEGIESHLPELREKQAQTLQISMQQARRDLKMIFSEHAPPPVHDLTHRKQTGSGQRLANPDIQEIITGIVKLLNGKVNMAVSSAKTTRPIQSTRINNRGPPRISDSPLSPDFDTSGMSSPPPKQPAVNETPLESSVPSVYQLPPHFLSTAVLNGVSFSETVVTKENPWKRPSQSGSVSLYQTHPGIVLDDTLDYTGTQGTQRPYGPLRWPSNLDTFDVVVSAIQGDGGGATGEVTVPVSGASGNAGDILTSPVEGQGFVSIDGKRTYLNLFDNTERAAGISKVQLQPINMQSVQALGAGFAVLKTEPPNPSSGPSSLISRPSFHRRPTHPPVRIDTCIVGDSRTCDINQHEFCATIQGVSACHCKPGFARITHTLPCKKIVSIVVSIRVDRIYERKVVWNDDLGDKDSEFYHTLVYEANRAIESAMSMTPFSDEYVNSLINDVYPGDMSKGQGGVFINATLKLTYEPRTVRPSLAGELQRHLYGVIQRRYNNIGNSALYVESPAGSISNLQDLDECASSELNDCHLSAICTNTWGGFICNCNPGLKDPQKGDSSIAGRICLSCPSSQCNNRGTCSFQGDQLKCTCTGNYYGVQCELDGEVLGVAIGASIAALIIIVLTLVCLVTWSRSWSREQKEISPVYGYIQGGFPGTLPAPIGSIGTLASVKEGPPTTLPPYMWAQVADHLATANLYATEPMGSARRSPAMFTYPTISLHETLPPVPLPRLQAPPHARQREMHDREPDSSDSELQDKDRSDLIPQTSFHVPRPKSRSSVANQSRIYYDVEGDQEDAQHLSKNSIPMSTYSMAPYYRT